MEILLTIPAIARDTINISRDVAIPHKKVPIASCA